MTMRALVVSFEVQRVHMFYRSSKPEEHEETIYFSLKIFSRSNRGISTGNILVDINCSVT